MKQCQYETFQPSSGFDKKHIQDAMQHQFPSEFSFTVAKLIGSIKLKVEEKKSFCRSVKAWLNFIMNASHCETKNCSRLERGVEKLRKERKNYFNGKTFAQNHHKNEKILYKVVRYFYLLSV